MGVYGRAPEKRLIAHLRRTNPAGILLLSRNIESPKQVRALIAELEQRLGRKLIVSIDHEGGWVVRFKEDVAAFPGNAALGRAKSPALARAVGLRMAEDLRALGITLNLAPVLDVLANSYNPGILIRSFGQDPDLCARLGRAFIAGLQEGGVWACAKHFPGKGAAKKDAHYSLPVIRSTRAQIKRALKPFSAAISSGVSCVMSSHVVLPALDSQPATFSAPIVRGILREGMNYQGVIVSDDLGMGGATTQRSVPQAAKDALASGHDLLIIAHDEKEQIKAADALRGHLSDNELAREEAKESFARFSKLAKPSKPVKKGARAAKRPELELLIARRAATLVRRGSRPLPWRDLSGPTLVVLPDFKSVEDLFCLEGGPEGPARFVKTLLRGLPRCEIVQAPTREKNSKALSLLEKKLRQSRSAVFFCFETTRFAGQKAALSIFARAKPENSAVCLIRDSLDARLAPRGAAVIDAFGFRNSQLRAALEMIFGRGRFS